MLEIQADTAEPEKVAKVKANKDEQQQAVIPLKHSSFDRNKKSMVEIELKDRAGNPVSGEKYKVTLPDGRIKTGTLDQNGYACVQGCESGTCEVAFPNLDKDAWEKG